MTRKLRLDAYVVAVGVAALMLFVHVATNPTFEPWHPLAILALFVAMVVAERISVPLPQNAAVSIATIPHIMAVLLLPAWLTMALAGGSMLLDQLLARAVARKLIFNVSSVALTTGVAALVADNIGLARDHLAGGGLEQVPAFLAVACVYYSLTNCLVAIVLSFSGQKPVKRILIENARFVLPAEFAVCGIGGLVTIVWLLNPAWAPLVLFPVIVSQVAYVYVGSSKRNQDRLAFVAEASRVLGLSLDQGELAERTVQLCVPKLGDVAQFYLRQEDGSGSLVAHAVADGNGGSTLLQPDATGAVSTFAARMCREAESQEGTRAYSAREIGGPIGDPTSGEFRSALVTAVRSANRNYGFLILLSRAEDPTSVAELGVIDELAQRCAAGLANAHLHAEAQRAARLRDDFLSIAAHELKTPVTSLLGYAQLLQKNPEMLTPAVLAKGLRTIENQSERLTELTRKLLDVSRIDSGKLQLETRSTDLSLLVQDAVLQAQDTTPFHTLQFTTCGACEVCLDPLRIEQVLMNLIGNAIKYSPDGGSIEIALERVGLDEVCLLVRDHGLGIPPERRGRLFERSYQAHGDGYLSGLGLGLFISKEIVELHGGAIEAQFPADGGTRMLVTLPIHQRCECELTPA